MSKNNLVMSKESLSFRNPSSIDVLISFDLPENLNLRPNTLVYLPGNKDDVYPELFKFLGIRKSKSEINNVINNSFDVIKVDDIKNYVEFLRKNKDLITSAYHKGTLVFSCHQGFSRSTAFALIAMYYLHLTNEKELLSVFLEKCPWAYPNQSIIRQFDKYMVSLFDWFSETSNNSKKYKPLFKLVKRGLYNKKSYATQLCRMHRYYIFDKKGIK